MLMGLHANVKITNCSPYLFIKNCNLSNKFRSYYTRCGNKKIGFMMQLFIEKSRQSKCYLLQCSPLFDSQLHANFPLLTLSCITLFKSCIIFAFIHSTGSSSFMHCLKLTSIFS